MKKRTLIIIFVAIFLIGALFAKFSGMVVTSINTCMDTDGGKSYGVKGTVQGVYYLIIKEEYTEEDYCEGNNLIEHYCVQEDMHSYREKQEYVCEVGCSEGKCIEEGLREINQEEQPFPLKKGLLDSIISKIRSLLRR